MRWRAALVKSHRVLSFGCSRDVLSQELLTLGLVPFHEIHIHLEIDDSVLGPLLKDAVNLELDPGDAVLFHNMLFHQGLPNVSNTIRWSADWRLQDSSQPTLRNFNGHTVRSRSHPESAVRSAEEWGRLRFQ